MRVTLDNKSNNIREPRALYIYFDHKFKTIQVVKPNMRYFGGSQMDWKNLADAITGSTKDNPKYYTFEVK